DNPYAIFKNLIINKKFSDYQHIWVINDDEPYEEYKKIKNVKFVSVNSNEYLYCLATSKYLINNTSFPPYFLKRKEQVYLNTWHGTPLKTLGKDMKGPLEQLKNLQRNFIQADYILSPNKFTTEKLTSSHNLVGIYNGEVLETGYPRIDLITETKEKEILTKLENYIKLDKNKKIALYAPTWRGNVGEEKDIKKEIKDIIKNMKDSLDESYQLVLKVHPLLYKFFKNDSELGDIFIPDFIDMCEILSIVDLLIT
ncbi:spore coat protein CotS, partial [Staphylococcus condimenti]